MPASGFVAVGVGAVLGAWLRWALGLWLNPVFPAIPLGTLSANLIGGLLIGGIMAASGPLGLPPWLRLLSVTGFLGGLTTFSTFSAETATLLLTSRFGWAAASIGLHVAGSLAMTLLGVMLVRLWLGGPT